MKGMRGLRGERMGIANGLEGGLGMGAGCGVSDCSFKRGREVIKTSRQSDIRR